MRKQRLPEHYRLRPVPEYSYKMPDGTIATPTTYYIRLSYPKDGGIDIKNITVGEGENHYQSEEDLLEFLDMVNIKSYDVAEMSTLHLVLKHRWYHAIEQEGKREEYRNPYEYWAKRLTNNTHGEVAQLVCGYRKEPLDFKHYDLVTFHDGYTSITQTWTVKEITFGKGNPEWGAPNHATFIIKLGERVDAHNNQKEKTL